MFDKRWLMLAVFVLCAGCLPSSGGGDEPENDDAGDTVDVSDDCGPQGCDVEVDPCAEVACGGYEVCVDGMCECADGGPEPCNGVEPSCGGQEGCRCIDARDCSDGLSCLSGMERDTGICADARQTCSQVGSTLDCDNGEDCITVAGPCSGTCGGVCLDEDSFDRMCASESASGWDCSFSPTTYGCRELWECLIPTDPGTLGEQACLQDASNEAIQRYIDMAECAEQNNCPDTVCLENQCPQQLDACVGDAGIPEEAQVDQTPFPCGGSLNPCPEQCDWVSARVVDFPLSRPEMATDGAGAFVFTYYYSADQVLKLATNGSGFIRERSYLQFPDQASRRRASVAIGPQGTTYIVYASDNEPQLLIFDSSGQASVEAIPYDDDFIIFDVWDLEVDDDGILHVAFGDSYPEYARRDPSGTWTNERIATDVTNAALDRMEIAIDGDGEPHVVTEWRFRCRPEYATRAGGTWSVSEIDAGTCIEYTDFDVDDSGTFHATTTTNNLQDILYLTNASGDWQLEQLEPDTGARYGVRQLGVTGPGQVHITYDDPSTDRIRHLTRADPNADWQESFFDGEFNRQLVLDRNDNLHFMYYYRDALYYRGWYCP